MREQYSTDIRMNQQIKQNKYSEDDVAYVLYR